MGAKRLSGRRGHGEGFGERVYPVVGVALCLRELLGVRLAQYVSLGVGLFAELLQGDPVMLGSPAGAVGLSVTGGQFNPERRRLGDCLLRGLMSGVDLCLQSLPRVVELPAGRIQFTAQLRRSVALTCRGRVGCVLGGDGRRSLHPRGG